MKKIMIICLFIIHSSANAETLDFCDLARQTAASEVRLLFQAGKWQRDITFANKKGDVADFFLGLPDTDGDQNGDLIDIDGNGKVEAKDKDVKGQKRYSFERSNAGFVYYGTMNQIPFEYTVHKDFGKYVSSINQFASASEKIVDENAPMKVSTTTQQAYVPYVSHSKGWNIYKYENSSQTWSMTKGIDWQPFQSGETYLFSFSEAFYVIDDQDYYEVTEENVGDLVAKYQLEKTYEKYDWKNNLPEPEKLPDCKN